MTTDNLVGTSDAESSRQTELVGERGRHLRRLIKIAILSGMAYLCMLLFSFPVFPWAPYLKYNLSDVPALLAGFAMGPLAGCAVVMGKCLLYALTRMNPVSLMGIFFNASADCLMVGTAAAVYARHRTLSGAFLALGSGILALTLGMIPLNLLLYPVVARLLGAAVPDNIWVYVLYGITPFNFLRGLLSGIVTFLLYKRLSFFLKHQS